MFEPGPGPRVFAVAPGADFPAALVAGLKARLQGQPPEAMARVTVYLNTQRMKRRIQRLFHDGPPGFLPRLELVTAAGEGLAPDAAAPVGGLARRLRLTRLVRALIDAQPDLAPPAAAFDLAGSLAALMDEAQVEGVPMDDILGLDVSDQSGHWERSLRFLRLVHTLDAELGESDATTRQRLQVEALIRDWTTTPPGDPVIVAGSTGSRGTTHMLMQAVARLPQGALILPGFDGEMPHDVWTGLTAPTPQEDHPQYRFAHLLNDLACDPEAVAPWHESGDAPDPARNRLMSLALRPAPVTDGWRRDGPALGSLPEATEGLTLIEAADPRQEAVSIALCLRAAAEDGTRAALISPDRMLTRRVAAMLDRWGITPDDSAGEPLGQTATGRLLRHLAGLYGQPLTGEAAIIILKSPLVAKQHARGPLLRLIREWELELRHRGPAFPTGEDLRAWAAKRDEAEAPGWAAWVSETLEGLADPAPRRLADLVADLRRRAERLVAGPSETGSAAALWDGDAGAEAAKALDELAEAAEADGGTADPVLWSAIVNGVLAREVRDAVEPHPGVMIWGTLEARVQGAPLVILGGLNDGVWPEQPDPDPWLNRAMRRQAGLLSPERRIGLSAHDFQQAASAPRVVLARALRSAEADATPSRWLNRMLNLMAGLPDQDGPGALAAMRARGAEWTALARRLDLPLPEQMEHAAPRPAPVPPAAARPRRMSVTEVEVLLRDPYQIYAKKVLNLRALDPLRHRPEAALRGTVLHKVLERAHPGLAGLPRDAQYDHLMTIGREVLESEVPWPTARRFWLARMVKVLDPFLNGEVLRAERGDTIAREVKGLLELDTLGVTLAVKTDRVDQTPDGQLWVYDYKSGKPPTKSQQRAYNRQLHITALIAAEGGLDLILPAKIAGAEYIGLGSTPEVVSADFDAVPLAGVRAGLMELFTRFLRPDTPFPAQVAREKQGDWSDYDHLSRGGEWDLTTPPTPLIVGDHE